MTDIEAERIEEISENSLYSAGVMEQSISHCFHVFQRSIVDGSILELGPAEGVMTDYLNQLPHEITIVEGSSTFCEILKTKHPRIHVVHSLFENFVPTKQYDNIIMGHVLEHVMDPIELLKLAKSWLAPGGKILTSVPNANSIHRQAAVRMGLLPKETSLNSLDVHHGHRRVFTPTEFKRIFTTANLTIDTFGGYWLKPISHAQIEENWTPSMINAFMTLGEKYPEIAGELYIIASNDE